MLTLKDSVAVVLTWWIVLGTLGVILLGGVAWLASRGTRSSLWYYNQGVDAYEAGQYKKALTLLNQAHQRQPDHAPTLYNLGVTHQTLHNLELARSFFEQSLLLEPDDPSTHYNLALIALESEQPDKALESLEQAKALLAATGEPCDADWFQALGLAYEGQGQLELSLQAYLQAHELDGDNIETTFLLGKAYDAVGQLETAIRYYHEVLGIQPDHFHANYELGYSLARLGQWDEAMACCQKVLSQNPRFAKAYNQMGLAHYCQGRYGEAITAYKQALALDPDYDSALNNLAFAYEAEGRTGAALEAFRQVASRSTSESEQQELLAHIDQLQHRSQSAMIEH